MVLRNLELRARNDDDLMIQYIQNAQRSDTIQFIYLFTDASLIAGCCHLI